METKESEENRCKKCDGRKVIRMCDIIKGQIIYDECNMCKEVPDATM